MRVNRRTSLKCPAIAQGSIRRVGKGNFNAGRPLSVTSSGDQSPRSQMAWFPEARAHELPSPHGMCDMAELVQKRAEAG